MARLRLELDAETYARLMASAVAARRPVGWHAEVLLRRVLGLLMPGDDDPRAPHPPVDKARRHEAAPDAPPARGQSPERRSIDDATG